MATKTVVCPECGSEAAPGRYACAECGALLAAVAVAHRVRGATTASGDDAELGGAGEREPLPEADAASAADSNAMVAMAAESTSTSDASAVDPVGPDGSFEHEHDAEALPFDEDASLATADLDVSEPDVLHDLPDDPALDEEPAVGADAGADSAAALTSDTVPPAVLVPAAATWPPAGDRGPIAAPTPRTPAGAYLPPSAVLPPLDAPLLGGAAAGSASARAVARAAAVPLAGPSGPDATAGALIGRSAGALSEALGSMRVSADASRRVVAAGAGLAALGTLLPWFGVFPGQNPLTGYFERWGLAGPGMWVVLIGLVALASIAASSGRAAAWPVGLPAVVVGAFLVGLTWRSFAGGFNPSIGVWVVLVGALLAAVGGALERRARHGRGDASVLGSADTGPRSDP
jgi:hypothetical protein